MSRNQGPGWGELIVVPVCLLVLLLVFVGPSACEALGVPRP